MAKDYDKIVKENLAANIVSLIQFLFNLNIPKVELLDAKMQYTIEQEPDFLFKVVHEKQGDSPKIQKKAVKQNYAIQVEFQTFLKKHKNFMLYRMIFYKGMFLLKYNIPLRQYVIYMSDEPHGMSMTFSDVDTTHQMQVINLKTIDYEYFLHSGKPELVVFAILADFKNKNPEVVITDIITELQKLTSGQLNLKKYASQLRVLSKLRTFEKVTNKILQTMPLTFNVQADELFLQGKKIGTEIGKEIGEAIGEARGEEIGEAKGEKKQAIITSMNMLLKTNFTVEQITDFSSADQTLVAQLKQELDKTDAKALFETYQNEKLLKKETTNQQELVAKALLKIPSLTNEIIAKLIELEADLLQVIFLEN